VIDPESYRVKIGLEGHALTEFSLAELRNHGREYSIVVTLMCTGNRRSEFNTDKDGETMGLPWKNGSISTAEWAGTKMMDALTAAGLDYDFCEAKGYRFMTFWGQDDYHVSIPLEKAFARNGDVILAMKMNNEALPRDHGFPLRVVVPGLVGARSVKWLDRIVLMKDEVEGMHQTGIAYKQLGPNIKDFANVPKGLVEQLPPIDHVPVTSAITFPEPGAVVQRGTPLIVAGYAYSGAGLAVIRVDVSIDGGETWSQAELMRAAETQCVRSKKAWAWVQWQMNTTVPSEAREKLRIVCKAIDDQYNQQPHDASPIWNVRGILNTSWGSVEITVADRARL